MKQDILQSVLLPGPNFENIQLWKWKLDFPARLFLSPQNKASTGMVHISSDKLFNSTQITPILSRYLLNRLLCIIIIHRRVCSKPHRFLLKKNFFWMNRLIIGRWVLAFCWKFYRKLLFLHKNQTWETYNFSMRHRSIHFLSNLILISIVIKIIIS